MQIEEVLSVVNDFVTTIVAKLYMLPLERAKLVLQSQDADFLVTSGTKPRYAGLLDCLLGLIQEEGILAQFSGVFFKIAAQYPVEMVTAALNQSVAKLFPIYDVQAEPFFKYLVNDVFAGGVSDVLAVLAASPINFMGTQVLINVDPNRTSIEVIMDSFHEMNKTLTGVFSLFSGLGPSILGVFAYRAAFCALNEPVMACTVIRDTQGELGDAYRFLGKHAVIAIAMLMAYPFDMVRTRLIQQHAQTRETAEGKSKEWKGSLAVASSVMKEDGFTGFFRGFSAQLVIALGPAFAKFFYTLAKKQIATLNYK